MSLTLANHAAGQSLDDGMLLQRRQLLTTIQYAHESWNEYWEGSRKRSNENIGTLTTQSVTWMGAYGLTDRVSIFAALPYVWTHASQGVLQDMQGGQDLTVAAKLRLLERRADTERRLTGSFSLLAGAAMPVTDYTPDFQPLSIGLGSRRALVRGFVHVQDRTGWFAGASAGYTWRSTVHLDRPAYYTDGRLVLSDEVAMPDVADNALTIGYQRGRLTVPVMLAFQRTLGGGDIRRQDMPFVSNRMDFTQLHVRAMYVLPRLPLPGLTLNVGAMRTLSGRNVGESTMLSFGLTSALSF